MTVKPRTTWVRPGALLLENANLIFRKVDQTVFMFLSSLTGWPVCFGYGQYHAVGTHIGQDMSAGDETGRSMLSDLRLKLVSLEGSTTSEAGTGGSEVEPPSAVRTFYDKKQ